MKRTRCLRKKMKVEKISMKLCSWPLSKRNLTPKRRKFQIRTFWMKKTKLFKITSWRGWKSNRSCKTRSWMKSRSKARRGCARASPWFLMSWSRAQSLPKTSLTSGCWGTTRSSRSNKGFLWRSSLFNSKWETWTQSSDCSGSSLKLRSTWRTRRRSNRQASTSIGIRISSHSSIPEWGWRKEMRTSMIATLMLTT